LIPSLIIQFLIHGSIRLFVHSSTHSLGHLCLWSLALLSGTCSACTLPGTQIVFCCVTQPMIQWDSSPLHDVLQFKLYEHSRCCCRHHSLRGCVCCHHCMMCDLSSSMNTAGYAAGITHWARLCVQAEGEFVAEGISKVHVQKADKDEDCWRYMLRWRRLPHVNMQVTAVPNSLHC